jgi:hypothetical protein
METADIQKRLQRVIRRLAFVAGGVTLAAAIYIGADIYRAQHPSGEIQETSTARQMDAVGGSIDAKQVMDVIHGKNVFRTTQAVEQKVVDELSHYELKGCCQSKGLWKSYIKDTRTQKLHVLQVGETLGNVFEVLEIGKKEIRLKRGDEEVTLKKG